VNLALHIRSQAGVLVFCVAVGPIRSRRASVRSALSSWIFSTVVCLVKSVMAYVASLGGPVEVCRAQKFFMFSVSPAFGAHESLASVVVGVAIYASKYRLLSRTRS